ncbi:MAG: UDP-N-acetylmuramoyl-tripeptide--D-alanyl-D-alanine ligase [bacterium]
MKLEFNLNLDDVLNAIGGQAVTIGQHLVFNEVFIDSRQSFSENSIFFALKGKKFNGEDFIGKIFQNGCPCAVISWDFLEKNDISEYSDKTLIAVEDTLTAYGLLAKKYLSLFNLQNKIAITGSSGKTTVKEMLYKILSEYFGENYVLKNKYNYNNQVGIPNTIFELNSSYKFLVLEIGTNKKGEIEKLSNIINPDIGAIINIGKSHLEEFKSLEGVLEEKYSMVSNMPLDSYLIINVDDPLLLGRYETDNKINFISFGAKNADLIYQNIEFNADENGYMHFEIIYKEKTYKVKLKPNGLHFAYDFMCSILAAIVCGVDLPSGIKAIESFELPKGRMEIIAENSDNSIIINDSYNSNPDSLKAAFNAISELYPDKKKIFVLGDMLELGEEAEIEHFKAGKEAAKIADYVFYTGNFGKFLIDGLIQNGFSSDKIILFDDKKNFLEKLSTIDKSNSVILFKGSRGMQMENFINLT